MTSAGSVLRLAGRAARPADTGPRGAASPPAALEGSAVDGRPGGDTGHAAPDEARLPNGHVRGPRAGTSTFAAGEEIFSPRSGHGRVYIVRSGCVRLAKPLPNGRAISLGLLGPNTIFTQEDDADGLATGAIAQALVESSVSIVEVDDLAALIVDAPELASAVVAGMTRRLTELQTLIEQLLARDAVVRLATALLALAHRFGQPAAGGMSTIDLPLTHQSLANMIGANRVTVTRKLRELQQRQALRALGHNMFAVDTGKLRAIAGSR